MEDPYDEGLQHRTLGPPVATTEYRDGEPMELQPVDPPSREAGDGACLACRGSKIVEVTTSHPCKNCSGLGYCSTQRGNRFTCSICNGEGRIATKTPVTCQRCQGTGAEPKVDPDVPAKEPEAKPAPIPDSIERVQWKESQGLVIDLTLTPTCLINTAGLAFIVLGILVLFGKVWVLAALLLLVGSVCVIAACGKRVVGLLAVEGVAAPGDPASQTGTSSSPAGSPKQNSAGTLQSAQSGSSVGLPDLKAKNCLTCDNIISIVTMVVIPNMILVYCFSDMGIGLETYSSFAPQHLRIVGDILVAFGFFFAVAIIVFDWIEWPAVVKVPTAIIPVLSFVIAAFLKALVYSWAPILMFIFMIPLGIGLLRVTTCRAVRRSSFYTVISIATGVCALLILIAWLLWIAMGSNEWDAETRRRLVQACGEVYEHVYPHMELDYDKHCLTGADLSAYSSDEQSDIRTACATAATVIFLGYACPFVAVLCNVILSLFCFVQGVVLGDINDLNRVQKILKQLVVVVVFCVGGVYASVNLSSASFRLGSTILAFLAAAFIVFLVWGYLEIGSDTLSKAATECRYTHILLDIWHSDWTKAVLLGGFNIFIPGFFGLNMLNQHVRKRRGITRANDDKFTPLGRKIYDEIVAWDLVKVMNRVCILAEVFFMLQVGVAKVTNIFLSWLNTTLSPLDLGIVILLVVVVGMIMFLLPPVPGVPVYVFAGIVISTRGETTSGVGYGGGLTIALIVSFILKLIACTLQYGIGYFLGKSIKIQQLIGVDKVFTRAIEAVLKEPGLSAGKVSILVGGPDWPTSVTCGILHLNLPQMLLGTMPVVLVTTPCVFAGAFLSKVTPGEDSVWNVLSQFALMVAVVANLVSSCMAAFIVLDVISHREEELSRERPEHAKVAELTRQGEYRARIYHHVTDWQHLDPKWKAVIFTATVLHLVAGAFFVFLTETCFENFSVSGKISDPLPDGLSGNWLNIVKVPIGWIPLVIFFIACILHFVFNQAMSKLTTRQMGQDHHGDAHFDDPPAHGGECSNPTEVYVTPASI